MYRDKTSEDFIYSPEKVSGLPAVICLVSVKTFWVVGSHSRALRIWNKLQWLYGNHLSILQLPPTTLNNCQQSSKTVSDRVVGVELKLKLQSIPATLNEPKWAYMENDNMETRLYNISRSMSMLDLLRWQWMMMKKVNQPISCSDSLNKEA